jgi:hypothetical protein
VANEKATKANWEKAATPWKRCGQRCQIYTPAGATCGQPCPKPRDHKGYHTCTAHCHTEGIGVVGRTALVY